MKPHRKLSRLDYVAGLLASLIFISYWLVIATFPNFFFVNPLNNSNSLRKFELILTTIGWILISSVAPILLWLYSTGRHAALKLLPLTAFFWPVSLIISQITSKIQTGLFYLDYLVNFPIFIYTDIALPFLILIIWFDLRDKKSAPIADQK